MRYLELGKGWRVYRGESRWYGREGKMCLDEANYLWVSSEDEGFQVFEFIECDWYKEYFGACSYCKLHKYFEIFFLIILIFLHMLW